MTAPHRGRRWAGSLALPVSSWFAHGPSEHLIKALFCAHSYTERDPFFFLLLVSFLSAHYKRHYSNQTSVLFSFFCLFFFSRRPDAGEGPKGPSGVLLNPQKAVHIDDDAVRSTSYNMPRPRFRHQARQLLTSRSEMFFGHGHGLWGGALLASRQGQQINLLCAD